MGRLIGYGLMVQDIFGTILNSFQQVSQSLTILSGRSCCATYFMCLFKEIDMNPTKLALLITVLSPQHPVLLSFNLVRGRI